MPRSLDHALRLRRQLIGRALALGARLPGADRWLPPLAHRWARPSAREVRASVEACCRAWDSDVYFRAAAPDMEGQWREVIQPRVRGADFSSVLELAPVTGATPRASCPCRGSSTSST